MPKTDCFLHFLHCLFEMDISKSLMIFWIVSQMNRDRTCGHTQIAIDRFANKWNKGRCYFAQLEQHAIEGLKCLFSITACFITPKTTARSSDIPVCQLLNKLNKRKDALAQVIVIHTFFYVMDKFL